MKPRTILAACIAALALASPPATAATTASAEMRFDNPGKIMFVVDVSMDGQEAQEFRFYIDQSGDRNDEVTASEVAAFEQSFLEAFKDMDDEDASNATAGGSFTIDGKDPSGFEWGAFDVTGAEGATSSTSPMQMRIEMGATFPVEAADRHTVHFEGSGDEGDDEENGGGGFDWDLGTAKVRAPDGYVFEQVDGLPSGASVSADKKTIDFGNSFMQVGNVDIVMTKGGGSSPGLGPVLVALMVVGAALLRRRAP